MRSRKVHVVFTAFSVLGLALGAAGLLALGTERSPLYYAAQLGGGSLAALAGGLGGTLVGGLSGALLGVSVEALSDPSGIFKTIEVQDLDQFPWRPIDWAFVGAQVGFGVGVGIGAAWGVVHIASVFGVAGEPQGALIGALVGSLAGMALLHAAQLQFYGQVIEIFEKSRREAQAHHMKLRLLVNPVTLAALGATIGYNLGGKAQRGATITVPLFVLRF